MKPNFWAQLCVGRFPKPETSRNNKAGDTAKALAIRTDFERCQCKKLDASRRRTLPRQPMLFVGVGVRFVGKGLDGFRESGKASGALGMPCGFQLHPGLQSPTEKPMANRRSNFGNVGVGQQTAAFCGKHPRGLRDHYIS